MSSVTAESKPVSPLVSVIIPTYNRADFIEEAIDSVLAQTYQNFEILVVDDGSTDNTRETLKKYGNDSRFHYSYQENKGQSAARNLALQRAAGEYVCFLDSDNRWLRDKLEKALKVFNENPAVDIVYGDIIQIDENGNVITHNNMKRYSGYITSKLLRDNFVSINTAMVRKRCFDEMGGLDVARLAAPDYELWLRFSVKYQYYYLPEYMVEYRVMENQISSDKGRRFKSNEEILTEFFQKFPNAVSEAEKKEGWSLYFSRKGGYYASVGKRKEALEAYLCALKHKPFHSAPLRGLAKLVLKRH